MYKIAGMVLMTVGMVGLAAAGVPTNSFSAPEIDPASASSAIALLMGGVAIIRGRVKK